MTAAATASPASVPDVVPERGDGPLICRHGRRRCHIDASGEILVMAIERRRPPHQGRRHHRLSRARVVSPSGWNVNISLPVPFGGVSCLTCSCLTCSCLTCSCLICSCLIWATMTRGFARAVEADRQVRQPDWSRSV